MSVADGAGGLASESGVGHLYVHSGLQPFVVGLVRDVVDGLRVEMVLTDLFGADFSVVDVDPASAVVAPVTNVLEARWMKSCAHELPVVNFVAVVDDMTGHQTYLAISSGASAVLNMRLVPPAGSTVLRLAVTSVLPLAAGPAAAGPAAPVAPVSPVPVAPVAPVAGRHLGTPAAAALVDRSTVRSPVPAALEPEVARWGEEERQIVGLLRGHDTIATIARRYYCSERSMYRRVRALYDELGVSGRSELRSVLAAVPLPEPWTGVRRIDGVRGRGVSHHRRGR